MKGYLIIFVAAVIAVVALAFSFGPSAVSDAPTADAGHVSVECVTPDVGPGETTKTCTVQFGSFCRVYVITWTDVEGDEKLNHFSEFRSLNITREPCS